MEVSSSVRKFPQKFAIENATQEQWRPFNRNRTTAKPKKSRRQLFRDNSFKSKDRKDSLQTVKRPSILQNARKEPIALKPIDGQSTLDESSEWQFILEFFHRELKREINAIGVEGPDGGIEVIENPKGLSKSYFHSASGARSLDKIMADGQLHNVDIEYRLVPVIERVSVRRNDNGECTVYTRTKPDRDNNESLAELLDESSSLGYASQADASMSTSSNDSLLPLEESCFFPIGSSTLSTEAGSDAQVNDNTFDMVDNNTFDMVDKNICLDDSQSSMYFECESSPVTDTTTTVNRSHQM